METTLAGRTSPGWADTGERPDPPVPAAEGAGELGGDHTPGRGSSQSTLVLHAYLLDRLAWLVNLRWLGIVSIVVALLVSWGLGLIRSGPYLFFVPLLMVAYNWAFRNWSRAKTQDTPISRLEWAASLQLLLDIFALCTMLHFAGGPENPFAMLLAFPVALGAMLLPFRMALFLAVAATVLHGGSVLAEFFRLLPHHRLMFTHSGRLAPETAMHYPGLWVFGYVFALGSMLFGIIYFVRSIAEKYCAAETLALVREQVAVSRERLARIGEFSAGVAHTVRNPLHGILNCVDLLRRKSLEHTDRNELLDLMSEGLRRIDGVTQSILRLTREAPLQKTRTDVGELVRDTVRFVEVKARKKTVPVRLELAELPSMTVDPVRLSEALFNVMYNAVDACESGAEIAVRAREVERPRPGIEIEVADTGTGIPEEHLPRIFDTFFTSKPVGEGSGLGLAITKRVAEEHGGEVAVQSTVGVGTRVRIFIPNEAGEGPERGPKS